MFEKPLFVFFRCPLQPLVKTYNFSNPSVLFEEGLYLASSEYWREYTKIGNLSHDEKLKLEKTFKKYWIRSCVRCTPYGTFAGTAIAEVAREDTVLILQESEKHFRHLRIDMNLLAEFINLLVDIHFIRDQILFYCNDTLYELPQTYRYIECNYSNNDNVKEYQITSIEKTKYLKEIFTISKNGMLLTDLCTFLVNTEKVNKTEALAFLENLIQSQLLVSDLELTITGDDPFKKLISQLEKLTGTQEIILKLKNILTKLNAPEVGVPFYKNLIEEITSIDNSLKATKDILQCDLHLNTTDFRIEEKLICNIVNQVEDVMCIAKHNTSRNLISFKEHFHKKYGDAEVPLTIALDSDLGIGYAETNDEAAGESLLINDLISHSAAGKNVEFDAITEFCNRKYIEYVRDNLDYIEITQDDISNFKHNSLTFPYSGYLMGSIQKKNSILNLNDFIFDLKGFGGPSAANLLGRFTSGDNRLLKLVKENLIEEEKNDPDAIFAEIVHLPQARIGNIINRPTLRTFEIPFVGKSGTEVQNQIPIDDIYVKVVNNLIILRSKKHNRRVIPRLATAHNFSHKSMPIYKFLCELQSQNHDYPIFWDWQHLEKFKHLPRVVYKNIIIKKARWLVNESDIKDLPKEIFEQRAYFKGFREKFKLPERVLYAEYDNELLIDFSEDIGLDLFISYIRRYKQILVKEFLFSEDNCIVFNEKNECYTNEIIIPLNKKRSITRSVPQALIAGTATKIIRKFPPNSQWLYFKIYCGSRTSEKILVDFVYHFVNEGISKKHFEKFFFIRYRDEFQHLRLRFYNSISTKNVLVQKTFMDICEPLLANGTLHKIQLDTYDRELERYGEDIIEESESIFHNDSVAVLHMLSHLRSSENDVVDRLMSAMRGIDTLLNDFGSSLDDKISLLHILRDNFFTEFGAQPNLRKQLNTRYRTYQKQIFACLSEKNYQEGLSYPISSILSNRSVQNLPTINSILSKFERNHSIENINSLLTSYIHLFINRLYVAQQRKYELVIYHFLEKYYTSIAAMKK